MLQTLSDAPHARTGLPIQLLAREPAQQSPGARVCRVELVGELGEPAWDCGFGRCVHRSVVASDLAARQGKLSIVAICSAHKSRNGPMTSSHRATPPSYFEVTAIASVSLAVFESVCGAVNAMRALFTICCATLGAVTVSEIVVDCPFWLR